MSVSSGEHDLVVVDAHDLSDYNPKQIIPKSPEIIQNIRKWLQPTQYDHVSGEFRKHRASHLEGTGDWLTSSDTYQKWLQSETNGLLWIQGFAGSGKSVMAANIIQQLRNDNPSCPVLFFFFRQIIDANHEPRALLQDWMDQLLDYSPPLQAILAELVEDERPLREVSTDDMWKHLKVALDDLPRKAFCVTDALDEMDDGHDDFLRNLGNLGNWKPDKVKVLMTSRLVPKLDVSLRGIPCLNLRLEEAKVDHDISSFVRQSLGTSQINREEWDKVARAVPGKANGIFLYAKLAMDAFLEPGADVDEMLSRIPTDLNDLYSKLLDEHSKRSGVDPRVQRLLLQAATHTSRPLRLLELAEMVDVTQLANSGQNLKATKHLIRAACGPLLEILPDETVSVIHHSFTEYLKGTTRMDKDDDKGYAILDAAEAHRVLAFACLQYLISGALDSVVASIPENPPDSDEQDDGDDNSDGKYPLKAHSRQYYSIDPTWLDYSYGIVSRDTYTKVPKKRRDLRMQHPFVDYAAANWSYHARHLEGNEIHQPSVNELIKQLLDNRSLREAWMRLEWPTKVGAIRNIHQLHIAAHAGLASYAEELLHGETDVDIQDEMGSTPLWWAASRGQTAVMEILLAAGADPSLKGLHQGSTPLHAAAMANNAEAIKLLMQAHERYPPPPVKPVTRTQRRYSMDTPRSPLEEACQMGHLEAVTALMEFPIPDKEVKNALLDAIMCSRAEIVTCILQHGNIDIHAPMQGQTLLYRACCSSSVVIIEAVLKAGARHQKATLSDGLTTPGMGNRQPSPDEVGPVEDNCIFALVQADDLHTNRSRKLTLHDKKHLLSLLIEAGEDINAKSNAGYTVLNAAATSLTWTKLLLEAGADTSVVDCNGRNALFFATTEVIPLLMATGSMDINSQDDRGYTPLLQALLFRDADRVKTLLKHKPRLDLANNDGNGVLHFLVRSLEKYDDTTAILRLLLDGGADPNLKNDDGHVPLMSCHDWPLRPSTVLDMFLEAGANINAQGRYGETILLRALSRHKGVDATSDISAVDDLIKRGASIFLRDVKGGTLLHQVIENVWRPSLLQLLSHLVEKGLDPLAVNFKGNNMLHTLALQNKEPRPHTQCRDLALWRYFLDAGLSLDAQNHAGLTPLHILCAEEVERYSWKGNKFSDLVDFVIPNMQNIDSKDKHGLAPLHIAATASDISLAKKLLAAGADPRIMTYEGMSPLHFAAAYRQPNNIGFLLEALCASGDPSVLSLSKHCGAAIGDVWKSPLFLACRSGVPESVKLLLDAGADFSSWELFAVFDIVEEDKVSLTWDYIMETSICPSFHNASVYCPMGVANHQNKSESPKPIGRMDEIALMLIQHGTRLVDQRHNSCRKEVVVNRSGSIGEHILNCMRKIPDRLDTQTRSDDSDRDMSPKIPFGEEVNKSQAAAMQDLLRHTPLIQKGKPSPSVVRYLLKNQKFHFIEQLPELGVNFLTITKSMESCHLRELVALGYWRLVQSVGKAIGPLPSYTKCQEDFSKDYLQRWKLGYGDLNDKNEIPDMKPLLHTAVGRVLPNMEVVRVLVEELGVDIHERNRDGETALHVVAGETMWWQTALAMPYLIAAGADLNARATDGATPLHVAIQSYTKGDEFATRRIEKLIEAGADVNAKDNSGRTCLSRAAGDAQLVRRLVEKGATVTTQALRAAIACDDVETVNFLLEANLIQTKDCSGLTSDGGNQDIVNRMVRKMPPPLWVACERRASSEIIQTLLDHGANPLIKFPYSQYFDRYCDFTDEDEATEDERLSASNDEGHSGYPTKYRQCVLLHQLLYSGLATDNLFNVEELNVNERDPQGRTVLHAACLGDGGIDRMLASPDGGSSTQTLFERLVALGADLTAVDRDERNILHFLMREIKPIKKHRELTRREPAGCTKSFTYILETAPQLLTQKDRYGNTPLHYGILSLHNHSNHDFIEAMIKAGASVQATTAQGDTVLHLLAPKLRVAEYQALFVRLVGMGVDVNGVNEEKRTPAFEFVKRSIVLEQNQHEEQYQPSEFPQKVQHTSALVVMRFLLEQGGDLLSVRDRRGRSLLHEAAEGHVEVFKALVDVGLDVTVEDDGLQTAIDVAAACENYQVLELFEEKGRAAKHEPRRQSISNAYVGHRF